MYEFVMPAGVLVLGIAVAVRIGILPVSMAFTTFVVGAALYAVTSPLRGNLSESKSRNGKHKRNF